MISMDKEYRTRCGFKVRVLCLDRKTNGPCCVLALVYEDGEENIQSYTKDGKFRISSLSEEASDLVEYNPAKELKVDDKIFVRDYEDESWLPRYFAELVDNKVYCFNNGKTSFSGDTSDIIKWNFWKKAE